ncbi:MAG: hypothetical protein U5N86_13410 [Planctomycetota bacterium]|nr:hypothetical protein [Planctomycetota bacterium]
MFDREYLNERYKTWLEWADRHYISARLLNFASLFHDAHMLHWMAFEKVAKLAILVKEERRVFAKCSSTNCMSDAMEKFVKQFGHSAEHLTEELEKKYPGLLTRQQRRLAKTIQENFQWRYPLNMAAYFDDPCSNFDYLYLKVRSKKPMNVEGAIEWLLHKDNQLAFPVQSEALFKKNDYIDKKRGIRGI